MFRHHTFLLCFKEVSLWCFSHQTFILDRASTAVDCLVVAVELDLHGPVLELDAVETLDRGLGLLAGLEEHGAPALGAAGVRVADGLRLDNGANLLEHLPEILAGGGPGRLRTTIWRPEDASGRPALGPPDLFAPPARSRRTMKERPWRSEWRRVLMALLAASGVSKSTRPQPLDLPPGCLATSAWTTVPTWEQWAVGREERGAGGAVSGSRVPERRIRLNPRRGGERFRRQEPGAPGSSRAVGCAGTTRIGSIGVSG